MTRQKKTTKQRQTRRFARRFPFLESRVTSHPRFVCSSNALCRVAESTSKKESVIVGPVVCASKQIHTHALFPLHDISPTSHFQLLLIPQLLTSLPQLLLTRHPCKWCGSCWSAALPAPRRKPSPLLILLRMDAWSA